MGAAPVIRINTPLDEATVRGLKVGDAVRISGTIIAARDAAHKRLIETLRAGAPLPVELRDQIIYYVGPTPARPGKPIGAAGPTTAGRMDVYTPPLLKLGLRGMIGKGRRSPEVIAAMQKHGAIFFAAVGGAGALLGAATPARPCGCSGLGWQCPRAGLWARRCPRLGGHWRGCRHWGRSGAG